MLSDLERHDLGWFVACLCTPLLGEDLAEDLPRYRPDSLLARETNGDLALLLPALAGADRRGRPTRSEARRTLVRFMSRHLVRTGFTLVMPRWDGWTSDLTELAEVFGRVLPGARAAQLRAAAVARVRADAATAPSCGRTSTTSARGSPRSTRACTASRSRAPREGVFEPRP